MKTSSQNSTYLLPERKQQLAVLAEAVAHEHCPLGAVSPESIVRNKQITLSFGSYKNAFDGMLEHKAGRFHIYCNLDRVERRDSARARFTLGHELGHYFIDDHRNALKEGRCPAHASFCEFESKNLVEQEADCFAANLLMPPTRFKDHAKRQTGLVAVISLAKHFGTSVTSAAVHFASLAIAPCAVLKWNDDGLAWKWLSYEARVSGYRTTIDKISQLVKGSATSQALTGDQIPARGYFQAGSTAPMWFPFIPHGAWRDVVLIEQAVPLGRFGVLTFLYPESGQFPCVV